MVKRILGFSQVRELQRLEARPTFGGELRLMLKMVEVMGGIANSSYFLIEGRHLNMGIKRAKKRAEKELVARGDE